MEHITALVYGGYLVEIRILLSHQVRVTALWPAKPAIEFEADSIGGAAKGCFLTARARDAASPESASPT